MKIFALLVVVFFLVSSAMAVRDPICELEHSKGADDEDDCRARLDNWSYNSATNKCVPFTYGGCGGNENNFDSLAKCEAKCKEEITVTHF